MEKDEAQQQPAERPPAADEAEDLRVHEKPRASLHSSRVPGRPGAGRHSLDTRRPPMDTTRRNKSDEPPPKERSMSVPLVNSNQPQEATQPSRQNAVRSSVEFDRRFDGPFARPSLAMTWRKSEHQERPPPPAADANDAADAENTPAGDQTVHAPAPGSTPALLEPEPPPLDYTLHTRKMAIFIFWSFIVFDSVVMPIALYFGLWYGVGPPAPHQVLSANAVFSIVTAAIGGASILEYFVRFWRLYKKTSTCRVIGARRWYLDLFHWNFSLAWIIVMFELIM